MHRVRTLMTLVALAIMITVATTTIASGQSTIVQQEHAFGTIAKGSTVCVGPLAPSGSEGVQLVGFTNGQPSLTWQVLTVSYNSAPAVVYQTTARSIDHVVPPSGNLLFEACAVKRANAGQDFELELNASPVQ